MRLHYFQHEPFEGLGAIEEWAVAKKCTITSTHFYKEACLPRLEDIDWLVIMGGAMSVNDEQELPWLVTEKEFVKKAIDAGKVVVGICLGCQMIANVLGSNVYPNKEKEIGWYPIVWENEALALKPFHHLMKEQKVLHWHGETYDLPKNAMRIAQSEACLNQGFIYQNNVVGLQFHMEFNLKSTDEMLRYCAHELKEGKYIQSAETITAHEALIIPANKALFGILDALIQ